MIDRIVEAFAHTAAEAVNERALFQTKDVPYLLAYSVIMLNTDLHNKNMTANRTPMTEQQFLQNNRYYSDEINGGQVCHI